ncbi:hypothetical protein DPMN_017503 [Dreissena polymorpha]|uniref:Uncharacterized protein n=1 Tax=Dreissena polymorpha TaxID=45954 RepID=A0A9D4S6F6_DREPO|nr:hypothetical protein DPMN_017503 [Dreissena polymorpha]
MTLLVEHIFADIKYTREVSFCRQLCCLCLCCRCDTIDECENDWWHSTSDDPDCQDYKPDITTVKDINCTYCCTTDNCNRYIKPAQDTLYTHPKK